MFNSKQKFYKLQTINYKLEQGFMALMSAIVMSVLLIAITLSLGISSFFGRFDILDSESKERSMGLAEACVSQATSEVSTGTVYATLTVFPIPNSTESCKRMSEQNGNEYIIKAQGEFNKSFTNLKVVVDSSTFDVVSWQECANIDISC